MLCFIVKNGSECAVKPVLSDHVRVGHKKWSLNRGGLLMEVKINGNAAIGT